LLFTLPGSPILYYRDEIGMGDNIWLDDRNGVRTPMQWNAEPTPVFPASTGSVLPAGQITDESTEIKLLTLPASRADRHRI